VRVHVRCAALNKPIIRHPSCCCADRQSSRSQGVCVCVFSVRLQVFRCACVRTCAQVSRGNQKSQSTSLAVAARQAGDCAATAVQRVRGALTCAVQVRARIARLMYRCALTIVSQSPETGDFVVQRASVQCACVQPEPRFYRYSSSPVRLQSLICL
jgi:hypothetical protein